jgi:glycerol-3-phosphate cytidylyltransferase-like family protein
MTLEELQLLVIVNCDSWLCRKHGFAFQNENERAEILDSIQGVDYTFVHQSDKSTIDDALYYFQPDFFLKGGDRSLSSNMPAAELKAVDELGIKLLYSVGGSDKVSSSSDLMKRCANFYYFEKPIGEWCSDIPRFCKEIHQYERVNPDQLTNK